MQVNIVLEIIKAVVLGIVEGITEWLPISSTGHMILTNQLMPMNFPDAFKEMFLVVIQLGAIMAVVVLYFGKLNPFSGKKTAMQKKETWSMWGKVLVACVPAGIIGLKFNDEIDKIFYNYQTVAVTLILYGVLFIVVENYNRRRRPSMQHMSQLTYKTALLIGVFQVLSLIPGTSRSGATILGGILLG
ncbi:MAG: undecaprenyl-diphosphate phosphatase, partial [Clostridiales bacterium]|nr:undecaprenyl-diphosphate phosphatase [Clostridiales bacterium]